MPTSARLILASGLPFTGTTPSRSSRSSGDGLQPVRRDLEDLLLELAGRPGDGPGRASRSSGCRPGRPRAGRASSARGRRRSRRGRPRARAAISCAVTVSCELPQPGANSVAVIPPVGPIRTRTLSAVVVNAAARRRCGTRTRWRSRCCAAARTPPRSRGAGPAPAAAPARRASGRGRPAPAPGPARPGSCRSRTRCRSGSCTGTASGGDEVAPPQLDRVDAQLVGRRVHQPLQHPVDHVGAGAAQHALLVLVRQHGGDVVGPRCRSVRADDLRRAGWCCRRWRA